MIEDVAIVLKTAPYLQNMAAVVNMLSPRYGVIKAMLYFKSRYGYHGAFQIGQVLTLLFKHAPDQGRFVKVKYFSIIAAVNVSTYADLAYFGIQNYWAELLTRLEHDKSSAQRFFKLSLVLFYPHSELEDGPLADYYQLSDSDMVDKGLQLGRLTDSKLNLSSSLDANNYHLTLGPLHALKAPDNNAVAASNPPDNNAVATSNPHNHALKADLEFLRDIDEINNNHSSLPVAAFGSSRYNHQSLPANHKPAIQAAKSAGIAIDLYINIFLKILFLYLADTGYPINYHHCSICKRPSKQYSLKQKRTIYYRQNWQFNLNNQGFLCENCYQSQTNKSNFLAADNLNYTLSLQPASLAQLDRQALILPAWIIKFLDISLTRPHSANLDADKQIATFYLADLVVRQFFNTHLKSRKFIKHVFKF